MKLNLLFELIIISFHPDGNPSFHPDRNPSFHPDGDSSFHPDGDSSFHPDISYLAPIRPMFHLSGYRTAGTTVDTITSGTPVAGWERRMIQLPRADMSGSFGNAYPEYALDLSTIPTLSSWGLNHQTSKLSLLSA